MQIELLEKKCDITEEGSLLWHQRGFGVGAGDGLIVNGTKTTLVPQVQEFCTAL